MSHPSPSLQGPVGPVTPPRVSPAARPRATAPGGDRSGSGSWATVRSATAPVVVPERTEQPGTRDEPDLPWNVIVWNDPVTLMSYVVYVLRLLFGYSDAKATRLMLQIHHEGRAVVSSGPRERAESDVHRLHAHGLQATMSREA